MTMVLCGGATGGHVFPALAVAETLQKEKKIDLIFFGKQGGKEAEWVRSFGLPFFGIPAWPAPSWKNPRFWVYPILLAIGWIRCWKALKKIKPRVLFATGGYVCVPVVLAAWMLRIPVFLLEPNVVPGKAVRWLCRLAKKTFLGFPQTAAFLPSSAKVLTTGTPVREGVMGADRRSARSKFGFSEEARVLLLLGGSQGARSLNQAFWDLIAFLDEGDQPVQVLWMTGLSEFRERAAQLEKITLKVIVRPFFTDIGDAYAAADLAVCRAGALTCAELCARALPAILVPYPYAGGHQEANARALEQAGAARVLRQGEALAGRLIPGVLALLSDPKALEEMAACAKRLGERDAARNIARELLLQGEAV